MRSFLLFGVKCIWVPVCAPCACGACGTVTEVAQPALKQCRPRGAPLRASTHCCGSCGGCVVTWREVTFTPEYFVQDAQIISFRRSGGARVAQLEAPLILRALRETLSMSMSSVSQLCRKLIAGASHSPVCLG